MKELVRQFPDEGPREILGRLQRTGVRFSQRQELEIKRLVDALDEAEVAELAEG